MTGFTDWPDFGDPQLAARLTLDGAEFADLADRLAAQVPRRTLDDAAFARALAYPWDRPAQSFLFDGEASVALGALSGDRRAALGERFAASGAGRRPLLAFGSNAAPATLARKLAALPQSEREVLVVAGRLHGFDAGASAHAAVYGALPATLFASSGAALGCSVLWVTERQLAALAWTELNYHFGVLQDVRFEPELDGAPGARRLFAFVSRCGALAPEGEPAALAAVHAHGRHAPAASQHELLTFAARRALGESASARDLAVALFDDYRAAAGAVRAALRRFAAPLESPHWRRFGG